MKSEDYIKREKKYGANNYHPLPIVVSKAEGVWVTDSEGVQYLDMLSAYSSVNQGHRHPKIINALKQQADAVTITSRAFYNEKLGEFYEKLSSITGKQMVLPMNTGSEAVETAIKVARKWGYSIKGVEENKAEIVVASGNFHGRTTTVISFSSEEGYKKDFGPFTPGFKIVPYGNINELESAIDKNTVAVLLEPIQGEAGIIVPKDGYLKKVSEVCRKRNILFMADEIQTGFGRTGQMFACDWEEVIPDVYIMGKALGGGVFPISAVAANKDILDVITPGSHGSTFGGNPLGAAVGIAALEVIEEERLIENSQQLGTFFLKKLKEIQSPLIKDVRGKGLFIGVELTCSARIICEKLKELGILCKETHEKTIRFAPPLIITKEQLIWALVKIEEVLTEK